VSLFSEAVEAIEETIEAMADAQTATRHRKQVRPIKGVRGVPVGEVARIASAVWLDTPPRLPDDCVALAALFGKAWEDGLVSIGLLAAALPDAPSVALDLGLDWAQRVDDLVTADALGWLVLGPGCLAAGRDMHLTLAPLRAHGRPAVRRVAITAALAATPTPVEGPSAAPIRARMETTEVRYVDVAQTEALSRIATATLPDDTPPIRKSLRRVLRCWAGSDPSGVVAWAGTVKGGLPSLLKNEVARAQRRVDRSSGGAE